MKPNTLKTSVIALLASTLIPATAQAQVAETLEQRVARLEQQNAQLMQMLQQQAANHGAHHPEHAQVPPPPPPPPAPPAPQMAEAHGDAGAASGGFVGFNPAYGFRVLDHAEGVNSKPLLILETIQDGGLNDTVTLSGSVTVLANYQSSNRNSKFAWLMRHPTSANQFGNHASEIVAHSAYLAATARVADDFTAYAELLYNPEQSFGSGTTTAISRNQVEMRKAFVMWGNLNERPVYVVAGKIDIPFGLNDTVSPFTNSTNWHAFAPLAYGGYIGYYGNGLHVRASAIGGGAQFRSANTSVGGTAVPSRVNNFAIDGNYTFAFGDDANLMAGGSYIHGSTYCQGYPVVHFRPCTDNVPAWAAYGRFNWGGLQLLGEFARTTKVFPGSAVPNPANPLSRFEAVRVSSLTIGGRYSLPVESLPIDVSMEFSNFVAGDDGAPWERQNQWVFGLSHYIVSNVNLFGEYIRTEGYVPLNFLSGGNFPDGSSWSDRDARSNIFTVGIQAAF